MSNNKTQAITYFNDAGKLYNIKLYDEALDLYKKAIDVDMTFADAHFCLSKTQIRNKDYENGIAHFQKFYHLIAESKQGAYVLALSNILIDEKQSEKALKLTEDSDIQFTEQQVFDYVPLLLANNRENQAIHSILQLKDVNEVSKGYKKLLGNEGLNNSIIEKLKSDNIIPKYFGSKNRLQKLSTAGIQHKEYTSQLKEAKTLVSQIREKKDINYKNEISKLETYVLELQNILAQQTEAVLKTDNLEFSKKLIGILESTKYTEEKLLPLKQELVRKEKSKTQKTTKTTVIAIVSAVIIGLVSYFGYNAYQKSDAYDRALNSNSISGYTSYLNKYGSDDKLDNLREEKLYQKAIETNNGSDINELSRLYPNSKKLRTVKITVDGETNNIDCFGVGDQYKNIDRPAPNYSIKVPVGSKIGYRINKNEKISITRYLTAISDLEIKETSTDLKKLLLSEEFSSNNNGWNTFQESKNVYGKTKNKGVKINNGELQIFHEYQENKFVLSTIYLSKLSKNIDFEIEASINRNDLGKGTFLLFGATKRAFNYVGFNGTGNYLYGYNNWDDSNDNWIKLSNGWQYNNAIIRGNYSNNILKVVNKNKNLTYYVNGQYFGSMPIKRWYGNRIGFGINEKTKAKINYLKVYQLRDRVKTTFEKDKTYFCWVDELNVRANGTRKGEILTTIKIGEPVKFIGGVGRKKINATFKGIFSPDYYYEVELIDGTVGWVHGGALNQIPTSEPIKFESFKSIEIPKKVSSTPSTDKSEFYMIAVYAENSESLIKDRVQELKSKGYSANYLWIPDYKSLSGTEMYSAYIGPFSTKEQCKEKLNQVKKTYPKSYGLLASKNTTQRLTLN